MEEGWNKANFEYFLFNLIEKKIVDNQWRDQILYSLQAGGKRFRPALAYLCGQALHLKQEPLYFIGAAVELLHTASLIHDDLPEIDDDDYRRGRLSHHKKYDHGTAVIAGDYMFFLAFELITELTDMKLTKYFIQCSQDLAYGEYLDIIFENQNKIVKKEIEKMYEYKTARLIEFSMSAPSILSKQSDQHLGSLKNASQKMGLAFQILDDLKGIEGCFEQIGKTPGKDAINNKKTFPTIYGIDESKVMVDQKKQECLSVLQSIKSIDGTDYKLIIDYISSIWNKIATA